MNYVYVGEILVLTRGILQNARTTIFSIIHIITNKKRKKQQIDKFQRIKNNRK
jgi:hypothetical protein